MWKASSQINYWRWIFRPLLFGHTATRKDGWTGWWKFIPIVGQPGSRAENMITNTKDTRTEMRIYNTIRVTKKLLSKPQHQKMVTVTRNICGYMAIEPLHPLYDKRSIISMNVIVEVTINVPFRIFISHYGISQHHLPKGQILVHLSTHVGLVIYTEVRFVRFLA